MEKKEQVTRQIEVITSTEGKKKALDAAIQQIEKSCGEGAIMRLGNDQVRNIDAIPTGSMSLDIALGVGGLPRGRIIEIFGPESSGKTTIAMHAIAEAQKLGGIAAIIDAEHSFDCIYATKLGIDINNLLISQPDYGEQALDIAEKLISSNAIDIIVIDSVAALVPKAEVEGTMSDNKVGLQARLMSMALRRLTAIIDRTNTVCIFINQLREKIGVMFGNPEVTTGGNALKFYASVRLDIRQRFKEKIDDTVVGFDTTVTVVKNKVAPPFRKAMFTLMFDKGIDRAGEVADYATETGIIDKKGSFYRYNGTLLAHGRDQLCEFLDENHEIAAEIEALVTEKLKADRNITISKKDKIQNNERTESNGTRESA